MKENLTEIVFIIDRSGSMNGLQEETIKGYNEFIINQKNIEGEAILSTVLFDDHYEVLHDRVNLKHVDLLSQSDYFVRGTTALYDAIGKSINYIGKKLNEMMDYDKPSKVIFVIITDGLENSSKEYSHYMIKEMIDHQQSKYNWKFTFLGANFDAEKFAESISISKKRAATYEQSSKGIISSYHAINKTIEHERKNIVDVENDWKDNLKKETIYKMEDSMNLKHRWTYSEDKHFCDRFVSVFVVNKTEKSVDLFYELLKLENPNIKLSSIKMKVQNMKFLLDELGIHNTFKGTGLVNYSNQNRSTMISVLREKGIIK